MLGLPRGGMQTKGIRIHEVSMRSTRQALPLAVVAALLVAASTASLVSAPAQPAKPAVKARKAGPAAQREKALASAQTHQAPPVPHRKASKRKDRPAVNPLAVAAQVDALIAGELEKTNSPVARRGSDEDFLRRVW